MIQKKQIMEYLNKSPNYDGMQLFTTQHLEWYIDIFDKFFGPYWEKPSSNDPNIVLWHDGQNYFYNLLQKDITPRFTSLNDRKLEKQNLSMSDRAFSNGMVEPLTWKGEPIMKTPSELALYQMLLWDLKPDNIIDLGTWNGAHVNYLNTLCTAYGLTTNIYSFDNMNKDSHMYADNNNIETYKVYENLFRNLKGRTLLIEDSHQNWTQVVDYIFDFLKPEDYIVIEDIANKEKEKYSQFLSFYANRKNQVVLDNKYIDYFGPENSSCGVGVLKKV